MRTLPRWGLPAVCVIALGWAGLSAPKVSAELPTLTVPTLPQAAPAAPAPQTSASLPALTVPPLPQVSAPAPVASVPQPPPVPQAPPPAWTRVPAVPVPQLPQAAPPASAPVPAVVVPSLPQATVPAPPPASAPVAPPAAAPAQAIVVPQAPIMPPSVLPAAAPDPAPVRVPAALAPAVAQAPRVQPAPPATTDDRIRALESQNRNLQQRLDELYNRVGAGRISQLPPAPASPAAPPAYGGGEMSPVTPGSTYMPSGTAYGTLTNLKGFNLPEHEAPVKLDMREGIRLTSADNYYHFEFHNLSQFDGRFFNKTGTDDTGSKGSPLHDTFVIPRQRWYFTGTAGKYFDFAGNINRGYSSLDVLDSYVNFKFDPAFIVRVGRTKVPYGYEYYKIAEGDLIGPERSVFVGNLSPNRELGVMAYGKFWDQRFDYAFGLFNGPQRSFQDTNNFKTIHLYTDVQPFMLGDVDILRHLHFVNAGYYGRENDPLEPNSFHTANDETTTPNVDNVSPLFLRFDPAARLLGERAAYSSELVWYYRSATALWRYDNAVITFAHPVGQTVQTTRVPFQGFSIANTYFLTGEEITRRKELHPLRDFDLRSPWQNPGAIEAYFRVAYLSAGSQIFSSGLSDPNLWARKAVVTDLGINWYLNPLIQVRFDWQHSQFDNPVQLTATRKTSEFDMFWVRTQLFY
jgi:phosphate-selective porin OprO/OprP